MMYPKIQLTQLSWIHFSILRGL